MEAQCLVFTSVQQVDNALEHNRVEHVFIPFQEVAVKVGKVFTKPKYAGNNNFETDKQLPVLFHHRFLAASII